MTLPNRPAGVRVLVIDLISQDPADIPSMVKVLDESGYSVTHIIGNDVTVERLKNLDDAVELASSKLGMDPHFKSMLRCYKQ